MDGFGRSFLFFADKEKGFLIQTDQGILKDFRRARAQGFADLRTLSRPDFSGRGRVWVMVRVIALEENSLRIFF